MNTIFEKYAAGNIDKYKFIKEMHSKHAALFRYSDMLANSVIHKIEIDDNGVTMEFRKSGIKMLVDRFDERTAPIEAFNFNGYEVDETEFIMTILKDMFEEGFTFFDIGANIGWYSLHIAKAIPGIRIHAFEPIPKTFSYLKRNITLNGLESVVINNFGLSNEAKDVEFFYYKEGSGNSSLKNLQNLSDIEKVKSRVEKLDTYILRHDVNIDFIKCDVEGAELFVFQGGSAVLKKHKPVVFTEMLRKWSAIFNYHPNEIISLFNDLDYSCYRIYNKKLIRFYSMDDTTEETNFVFLHNNKHLKIINKYYVI